MSIATAISRLIALRNRLRTKINSLGIDSDTQLDLDDCVGAVERIGGTQEITQASVQYNVADKQYARVTDSNLVPGNIVSGVSILGVAGTASVSPPSARLTQGVAIYGNEDVPASMYPPNGYDGFSSVVFRQDDIVGNRMLVSTNIRSGVRIMGVNGTYETPTETKAPTLAELDTDGITSHSVAVTPSSGKHLSQVTIPKITSAIDSNIAPGNIRSGVGILGVTGTYDIMQMVKYSHNGSTDSSSSITFTVDGTVQAFAILENSQFAFGAIMSMYYWKYAESVWVRNFYYIDVDHLEPGNANWSWSQTGDALTVTVNHNTARFMGGYILLYISS